MVVSEALGGVHLETPDTGNGRLQGGVRFPKRSSYRLQLLVRLNEASHTKAESHEDASAATGYCDLRLFIGSDFDALQELPVQDVREKVRALSASFPRACKVVPCLTGAYF